MYVKNITAVVFFSYALLVSEVGISALHFTGKISPNYVSFLINTEFKCNVPYSHFG